MKLWAGRFQKETDALVNDFNSSISFDARMYREDITGSIAHAAMLGRQGIIKEHEAEKIIDGLKAILADIEAGQVEFSLENEDIHMNIETILTQRIGDTGKRLHTARSRNDQVAVDFRMYVRKEIQAIIGLILDLEKVLVRKAEANLDTVMPGYTHLQRAQPTTFAHAMMAYANMFKRDVTRLEDCLARMDECPLGAGALATSTYPVDRFQTAQALGFSKPTDNSLDSVSDRDFALEFLSACSILMMHLSRFSEEIILWCSWEFKFVELDDAYSTGSSIMPQKKNPDVAELLRGKTGRVYGSLITLLTVMKGLPLAYNKDMQEDKECVFDAIDTVELCLPVFTAMLDTLTVRKENMRRAAAGGFINATDCADYLVKKGMPFREAYLIVGRLVSQCIRAGETLDTLSLKDFKAVSKVFDEDVYQALELRTCVNGRKVCGGPAADSVRVQIGHIREIRGDTQTWISRRSLSTAGRAPLAFSSGSGSPGGPISNCCASARPGARTRRSGKNTSTRPTWCFSACPMPPPGRRWGSLRTGTPGSSMPPPPTVPPPAGSMASRSCTRTQSASSDRPVGWLIPAATPPASWPRQPPCPPSIFCSGTAPSPASPSLATPAEAER